MTNNELININTGEVQTNSYNSIAMNSQAQKELAQVQVQAVLARQCPRDYTLVEKKIESLCGSKSLASMAEYEYARGGAKVSGASIKLIEAIASVYGNIQSSYKVLEVDYKNHVAKCSACAWDIENNAKSEIEFEVQLKRSKKDGTVTYLEDERDINEMISNFAQRRKRKCIETIIPANLIELARQTCDNTLNSDVDYQKKMSQCIDWLQETHRISCKQIEEYFGMGRQGFTNKTYAKLVKICASIKDGMAKAEDIFKSKETKAETTQEVKDDIKNQIKKTKEQETPKQETPTQPETTQEDKEQEFLDNMSDDDGLFSTIKG